MTTVEVMEQLTDHALILCVSGELDCATADACAETLLRHTATLPPPSLAVLDLRGVEFMAAAGMHALQTIAADCAQRGVETALVAEAGSHLGRILRIVGMDREIPLFDSVESAVRP